MNIAENTLRRKVTDRVLFGRVLHVGQQEAMQTCGR